MHDSIGARRFYSRGVSNRRISHVFQQAAAARILGCENADRGAAIEIHECAWKMVELNRGCAKGKWKSDFKRLRVPEI
ncbi:MAG: hypothetical protein U1F98_12260 [Verrucomicrobiota bacterium]